MDGDSIATDNEPDTDNELTENGMSEEHAIGASTFGSSRRRHSEHHRRHVFLADRLQGYSDAVFAIVGTILIAYLQNIVPALDEPNVSIRELSFDNTPLYAVYHFTFFHVTIIWLNHSRIFGIIERVNDVLVWMNMLLLYVVSFVPLTFGLLGEFRDTYQGILSPSIVLVVVNVIMMVIVWYAFKREKFLHIELPKEHYTLAKRIMYCNLLFSPVFAVLGIGLGSVNFTVAQACFYLSTIMLILPRLVIYIYWKVCMREGNSSLTRALGIYISKDRVEFFTDGIYSIVSTLIILEITVQGIPSRELVNSEFGGSLVDALSDRRLAYITHFTTFLMISLLWFVHHSLFNFVRKLNPLMLIVHLASCSLLGAVPPTVEVLSHFFNRDAMDDVNEAAIMQIAAVVIMVIGILQLVFLSLMYFTDSECVDPIMFHTSSSLHLFLKVMIIPITCFITYWSSFGPPEFRLYAFYVLYICSPLEFILINVAIKSGKLRSLFVHCWELRNGLRERLQKKCRRLYEVEMEMKDHDIQERPE